MRLRSIPVLVLIVALIAVIGAWSDRLHVQWTQGPPVVHAKQPWNATVQITRRGRGVEGYRPIVILTGPNGATQRVAATDLGGGRYAIRTRLHRGGFYTYTLLIRGDGVAAHGTVYAIPR
jgi:hypothetical protein